jgi:cold shock CspA family protein
MRYAGTVKSFDAAKGRGLIEADSRGEYLIFERSGIYFNPQVPPLVGQRFAYELGSWRGERRAMKLGNV